MASTAAKTVRDFAAASSETKYPTISLVKPSVRRQRADTAAPTMMKGRRRPHFDLDSSAMAPTMGCTMRPERGPAIHTSDVLLFVKPSDRRYGVQSVRRVSSLTPVSYLDKGNATYFSVLTCLLNAPDEAKLRDRVSSQAPRECATACATYDIPMALQVRRNILVDSVLPLIEG